MVKTARSHNFCGAHIQKTSKAKVVLKERKAIIAHNLVL